MYLISIYGWPDNKTSVVKAVADAMEILVFEARQKITGGEPVLLTSFADQEQAEALAQKLEYNKIPTLLIDTQAVRQGPQPLHVRHFELGPTALHIETMDGTSGDIDNATIELLLVATCSLGLETTTDTVTKRKFSLGKTLLAGGIPMTQKVTHKEVHNQEEREETLWLYAANQPVMIFDRAALNYEGLGDAMQMARALNFSYLKKALRRLAPQAHYNDRLLKRADLVRILGPSLSPETDLDLAFEILSRSLKGQG